MPKKSKTKSKVKATTKTRTIIRNKNSNVNTVHVHVEKPKTKTKRTRRTSTPKEETLKPLTSSSSISSASSQGLSHHRGLVNNELQQPTIIQQLQAVPDPRIDKLEKRTKKMKELLKENKDNVQTPQLFQDAVETPLGSRNSNSRLIKDSTVTPTILDFNPVSKPNKSMFSRFFSSGKKIVPETELFKRSSDPFKDSVEPQPLLLEYKPGPENPAATAPDFIQSPTGKKITQVLKNLVNEIHAKHPNKKMHQSEFSKHIAAKLRELGVETSHTKAYLKNMNHFYSEIYKASHEIQPA